MQLLGRGIRCFSTVPSKVIHNWQFVLLLISIIQARGHPKVHVEVQEVEKRKAKPALEGLKFGTAFTDHMLVMEWAEAGGWQVTRIWCFFLLFGVDNNWQAPKIVPQGPLAIHPGATALQYAQVMFYKFQIKNCIPTLLFSRSSREWKLCGALMIRSRYYLTTCISNHIHHWTEEVKTVWFNLWEN